MTLPIPPGHYTMNRDVSQIGFAVEHLGISWVRGRFSTYDGNLVVGDDLTSIAVTVEVDMSSVDTGHPIRDAHLRKAELLDIDRYPRMVFRSSTITGGDSDFRLGGELTIKGVTRRVDLDVRFNGSNSFPPEVRLHDPSPHFGFSASGVIHRSDFDAGWGGPITGDVVRLEIETQFVLPAAAAFDEVSMARIHAAREAGRPLDVESLLQEIQNDLRIDSSLYDR